jgi:hypothetical protein
MDAGRKKLLTTLARSLDAQTESIRKGTFVPNAAKVAINLFAGVAAKKELGIPLNQPTPVDVSAEGMKKKSKTLARGTGVTYSDIRTTSQGLLTGAKTEKKTLLGG